MYAISLKQSFLIVGTRSLTDVPHLIRLKLLQQFVEALLTIISHPLTYFQCKRNFPTGMDMRKHSSPPMVVWCHRRVRPGLSQMRGRSCLLKLR